MWSATLPYAPPALPARLEFKFLALPAAGGGPAVWEAGANHSLDVGARVDRVKVSARYGSGDRFDVVDTRAGGGGSPPQAGIISPPPTPAGMGRWGQGVVVGVAERLEVVGEVAVAVEVPEEVACARRADVVYICGSGAGVGEWVKEHSVRLREEGGVWRGVVGGGVDVFEYKYLVRRGGRCGDRIWEGGDNRVAVGGDIEDCWEKMRIEFTINYPVKDGSFMYITGDMKEIGGWFNPGPVRMALGAVEMLETDVEGRKWKLKVFVDRGVRKFSYRYMVRDEATGVEFWEREPNRHANFDKDDMDGAAASGDSVAVAKSVRYRRDVNFVGTMAFDEVPPGMFIGPYPQTAADVDALADAGATAVFNVQTAEDFKHRGIDWSTLSARYRERDVEAVLFPIRDFDKVSLAARVHAAAHELNRLIDKEGKKVYIHCTAGMGRAPAVAVAYLCWCRGFGLDDAVKHVKSHRTVACPNVPVLRDALKRPF